jgi:polyisoprenoid-binding protein YceI
MAAGPLGAAAQPALWRVDPGASRIDFEYRLADNPRAGVFAQFEGEGDFDPADLAATRLDLRIRAEGLTLDNLLETAFAKTEEWFDAENHPVATFRLESLEGEEDSGWTARGTLTIKGARVAVAAPLALSVAADRAEARGTLAVNRRDFDLGTGLSDAVLDIADTVTVRFTVVARPQD